MALPLLWLGAKRAKLQKKRFSRYAEAHLLPHYNLQRSPFWLGFKLFLLVLAMMCIIIALVRPQWDYEMKDMQSSGMDIVFAIDVSKSMDATDMQPSRLLRAVLQIGSFLDQVKTDRIGIIAFSGIATLECPLTDDYEALKIVLNSLSSNTISQPGTDIGAALKLAGDAFSTSSGANSLILISDGEDLEGSALRQAKMLKERGIRVHCMGVGSPEGIVIRHPETGEEVLSKLDEATLKEASRITGGEYYRVTPGGDEIQLILKQIYASEESRTNSKRLNVQKEQYYLFACLALLLLILESLIDPRKRKTSAGESR
ncbi:MAG: VWA domain-containing protein [Candidatus Cloacimonas sp.]|nr:VWA domain-containing protein [Candidatus Cloacimonas sp.]